MADYTLTIGTAEGIVDEDGNPILEGTTTVAIADTGIVQLSAQGGALYLTPVSVGSTDVTITRNGVSQTHAVTVADDFDWSLAPEE